MLQSAALQFDGLWAYSRRLKHNPRSEAIRFRSFTLNPIIMAHGRISLCSFILQQPHCFPSLPLCVFLLHGAILQDLSLPFPLLIHVPLPLPLLGSRRVLCFILASSLSGHCVTCDIRKRKMFQIQNEQSTFLFHS